MVDGSWILLALIILVLIIVVPGAWFAVSWLIWIAVIVIVILIIIFIIKFLVGEVEGSSSNTSLRR